ncbi:Protein of unknown function [Cotesia congregata]|uniref:Uncharacterized protein n=1 Tax=Cotesia congregata TaxID=51543 RepID=A0A8J2HKH3_COTCN|nr:Protein of unknown function [Cotesia congregata]
MDIGYCPGQSFLDNNSYGNFVHAECNYIQSLETVYRYAGGDSGRFGPLPVQRARFTRYFYFIDAEATNASLIEVKEMIFALGSLYETGYDRTETDEKMDLLIDEVLRKFYCEDDYDVTPDKEFKKHKPLRPLKIGNSGINNGLSIVREPELDDYFFTFFEMIGWKIAIFNSGDYPDNTSGGVSEVLISPSTENFIQLTLEAYLKRNGILPHKVTNPEEVENFERAVEGDGDNLLHCNSCYPACNDVSYNVYTDFVPLQTGYYQSELLDNLEVKDQSIVHIYFINFGSVRLKMDLGYYWYELLSNIGGICGIFIGFSLLSLVELGYFFLGFIYEICCPGKIITEVENTIEDPRDPGDTVRSATDMQSVNRIYWNALLSQPRIYDRIFSEICHLVLMDGCTANKTL